MKVKRYKKFLFATSFVVAFFSLWFLGASVKKAMATTGGESRVGIFKKMSTLRKQNERMFIGMANGENKDLSYYDVYLNDGRLVQRGDVIDTKNSIVNEYTGLPQDMKDVTYSVITSLDGTQLSVSVLNRKDSLVAEFACEVATHSCEKASLITDARKVAGESSWNAWDSLGGKLFGKVEKNKKSLFAIYSVDDKKVTTVGSYEGISLSVPAGSLSPSLRALTTFNEETGKVYVFSTDDVTVPVATYEGKVLGKVTSVAWSPDEEFFVYSTKSAVTVINTKSGKVTSFGADVSFGQKEVLSDSMPLVISSSGRYVLFVDYYREDDEHNVGQYVSVLKSIDLSSGGKMRELLRSHHIELFPHQYR